MKKLVVLLITLLWIPSVYALTAKSIPITDYVNDYAGVLSSELKESIIKESKALNDENGTQIVVVTMKTLDGNNLETFANELYNYNKIGKDSKGLLILLVVNDRKVRVEVGDNLEGILNDGKVGRYMDTYMIPYFKNNDWENGIKNGYIAFYKEITGNTPNLVKTTTVNSSNTGKAKTNWREFYIFVFIVLGILVSFVAVYFLGVMRQYKPFEKKDLLILIGTICPLIIFLLIHLFFRKLDLYSTIFFLIYPYLFLKGKYRIPGLETVLVGEYNDNSSDWGSSSSSGGGFSGGGGSSSGGGASRSF